MSLKSLSIRWSKGQQQGVVLASTSFLGGSTNSPSFKIILLSVEGQYTDIVSSGRQEQQQQRRSRWRKSKVRIELRRRGERVKGITSAKKLLKSSKNLE